MIATFRGVRTVNWIRGHAANYLARAPADVPSPTVNVLTLVLIKCAL